MGDVMLITDPVDYGLPCKRVEGLCHEPEFAGCDCMRGLDDE